MIQLTELEQLYEVAEDDEKDILDDLRIRAKLAWYCVQCGWMNIPATVDCESCGSPDPETLSTREHDEECSTLCQDPNPQCNHACLRCAALHSPSWH